MKTGVSKTLKRLRKIFLQINHNFSVMLYVKCYNIRICMTFFPCITQCNFNYHMKAISYDMIFLKSIACNTHKTLFNEYPVYMALETATDDLIKISLLKAIFL